MDSPIIKARSLASHAHFHQNYGDKPYMVHLESVVKHVLPFGETAQIIAYLHDTVEDTAITVEDIHRESGPLVATCVHFLTDEPGRNRRERKQLTFEKMASIDTTSPYSLALIVKTADRLANIEESSKDTSSKKFKMYAREHLDFKKAVYRNGLCDDLWNKIDELLSK